MPNSYNKFQAKYIAQCIEEIKQELRQENMSVKATAVAKLTYVRKYLDGISCVIEYFRLLDLFELFIFVI